MKTNSNKSNLNLKLRDRHKIYSILNSNHIILKLALILIIIMIPINVAQAASTLKINYNKKNVNYKGKQVTYVLDGKKVNKDKYPGVIIDEISLAPAYDVFNNKSVGSKYSYSSKTNKITIKKGKISVSMTLNSKTAYINGVKTTMPLAPIKIKYRSTGSSKVLVPARFVCEALGFKYTWNSAASKVTLVKTDTNALTLYYDNKWRVYNGTQGKVTLDGKTITVTNMPSIIINDTAMLYAWKVFTKSSIGASYQYDKSSDEVTLKTDEVEIVLTLGSKNATVNGEETTVAEAPRLVKNKKTNKSYIIVPGESISYFLGYNYKWNTKAKTSEISTREEEPETPDNVVPEDETPENDTPVNETPVNQPPVNQTPPSNQNGASPLNPDKTYVGYNLSQNYANEYNNINAITNSNIYGNSSTPATLYSVSQDMLINPNKDVYTFVSSTPFGNISSTYKDASTISIDFGNTYTSATTYFMNPGLVDQIQTEFDAVTNKTKAELFLSAANAKYEMSLSDDKCTLYVNVYKNYITKLEAGYKGNTDIIQLTGLYTPNALITEDQTHIYLDFASTINGLGTQNNIFTNGSYLEGITVENPSTDTTRIIITKSQTSDYIIQNDGNSCIIKLFNETNDIDNTISSDSLKIKNPEGIDLYSITDEDLYYNKQFKIIIPGDYVQFYQQNPTSISNSIVNDVSYSLNQEGNTEILIKTNKLQGYKYTLEDGYIIVQVGDPRDIYDKIVVLDAGHGDTDPGTSNGGYQEKNINYKIMYVNAKQFFDSKDSDIKAYWTRHNDTLVSLSDRAAFAKKIGADMFLSLHMNSAGKTASGLEVFYSSSNNATTDSGLSSKTLATIFADRLTDDLDLKKRGAKDSRFIVVKNNTVPAVLIELGFLSNPGDFKKLVDSEFQMEAAKSIYETTKYVFDEYPTQR